MSKALLSLGSNLGDRLGNLNFGVKAIHEKIGPIVKVSSIYQTKAVGFESETDFYNICISLNTDKNPEEILDIIETIELESGRTHKSMDNVYHSRTLDIDIVFMEQLTILTKRLMIPHPRYTQRKFVLLPLQEIEPDFWDHKRNKTITEILNECSDLSFAQRLLDVTINNY